MTGTNNDKDWDAMAAAHVALAEAITTLRATIVEDRLQIELLEMTNVENRLQIELLEGRIKNLEARVDKAATVVAKLNRLTDRY